MRAITKRILIGLAIAVGAGFIIGMAGAILLASPVHAFYDGHSPHPVFLAHIHSLRFPDTPDDAYVTYGHKVCKAIEARYPVSEVQTDVENALTPKGFTVSEADGFVTYAHDDLCPNAGR